MLLSIEECACLHGVLEAETIAVHADDTTERCVFQRVARVY